MFCTKCGQSLPEGSRFCTNCGAVLDAQETVQEEAVQQPVNEAPQQPVAAPQQPVYAAPSQPVQPYAASPRPAKPLNASRWSVAPILLSIAATLLYFASIVLQFLVFDNDSFTHDFWVFLKPMLFPLGIFLAAFLLYLLPTKRLAFLTALPWLALLGYWLYPIIDLGIALDKLPTMQLVILILTLACPVLYLLGTLLPRLRPLFPILFAVAAVAWIGVVLYNYSNSFDGLIKYVIEYPRYESFALLCDFLSCVFFACASIAALFSLKKAE